MPGPLSSSCELVPEPQVSHLVCCTSASMSEPSGVYIFLALLIPIGVGIEVVVLDLFVPRVVEDPRSRVQPWPELTMAKAPGLLRI